MSDGEQITHFADELDKLVDRFRSEYEITMAGVVGVLHMKAHLLCEEASRSEEEE